MTRVSAIVFCLLAASLSGCSKNTSSPAASAANASALGSAASDSDKAAVTAAIEKHLRSNAGINMSAMDMNVTGVSVTGDRAQANAEFHLKQGGASMTIGYKLERHDGDWTVLSDQPTGGEFAHPPMDNTLAGAGAGAAASANGAAAGAAPNAATGAPTQAPSAATPSLPDVTDFLKTRPSPVPNPSH